MILSMVMLVYAGAANAFDLDGYASLGIALVGALIVWLTMRTALRKGHLQAARALLDADRVDGVVGLGCVIRGETAHYDYMCEAAIGGLAAIGRETGRPVTCGVLTTETLEQAFQRSGGKLGNKGFEAAQALLECLDLARGIDS